MDISEEANIACNNCKPSFLRKKLLFHESYFINIAAGSHENEWTAHENYASRLAPITSGKILPGTALKYFKDKVHIFHILI